MSLPLRLAIMFTPVLVWGLLYLTSRLGAISPTRFVPWLTAGFVVLLGVSLILFAFDRAYLSDIVAMHGWGLAGAQLWIQRHYKQETKELVTSLKL